MYKVKRPYPRSTWTSSDASGDLLGRRSIVRLHHTVARIKGGKRASLEVERAFWRMIRNLHVQLGKGDIAYSFGVTPAGRRYNLRGFRVGAHTCNHNSDSFAIVLAGNYEEDRLTDTIARGVRRTLRWMIDQGKLTKRFDWAPHSETGACSGATACPGKNARARMQGMVPKISRR